MWIRKILPEIALCCHFCALAQEDFKQKTRLIRRLVNVIRRERRGKILSTGRVASLREENNNSLFCVPVFSGIGEEVSREF